MNRILRYSIALLVIYLLAWTVSYAFVLHSRGDGLNFSYFIQYFVLAWTFNGFELPTFILIFSIVGFLPVAAFIIILMRKHDKQRGNIA